MFKLIRKEFTVATIKNYLEKVRLCSLSIRPVFMVLQLGLTINRDWSSTRRKRWIESGKENSWNAKNLTLHWCKSKRWMSFCKIKLDWFRKPFWYFMISRSRYHLLIVAHVIIVQQMQLCICFSDQKNKTMCQMV